MPDLKSEFRLRPRKPRCMVCGTKRAVDPATSLCLICKEPVLAPVDPKKDLGP